MSVLWIASGCEEPEADELRVQKIRRVLIMPLGGNGSDGVIAAGRIGSQLEKERPGGLTVMASPVVWRIGASGGKMGNGLPDAEAVELARQIGADGVVTGSTGGGAICCLSISIPIAIW